MYWVARRYFPNPDKGVGIVVQAVLALLTQAVDEAIQALGGLGTAAARLTVVYDRSRSPSIWHEVEYARTLIGVMEQNYPETLAR